MGQAAPGTGSGRPLARGPPLLDRPLVAELLQRDSPLLPLPPRLSAHVLQAHSTRRFGMACKLADRPGHDRVSTTPVVVHGHVPLDDPRLLDVGTRGPHGDVVAADEIFLPDP